MHLKDKVFTYIHNNKPTHYRLDHGDFYGLHTEFIIFIIFPLVSIGFLHNISSFLFGFDFFPLISNSRVIGLPSVVAKKKKTKSGEIFWDVLLAIANLAHSVLPFFKWRLCLNFL